KDALDAWRTRALDAEERERTLIQSTCPDKDAHWRLDEALADLQAAEDRAEQAEKEQGNLRAMKERLETAETRIQAVRDVLNYNGHDGPVAPDALPALNNPDGSPDQPCGRGPCALGNNHTGPCRR